ncbi:MAG TPA: hypothetical protein VN428_06690 [Bryobacteraceae bacterium]|nr:hypothetical protein [Bryobacteraceae bacterium]
MAAIATTATQKSHALLTGGTGLAYTVAALSVREGTALSLIEPGQVMAQRIQPDVAERSAGVTYPAVYVYCEGVTNQLREKFRTFSGKVSMAMEARVTHDRIEKLTAALHLYTAAITEVLDTHRGDWGNGMFYTGGYKIEYGPVKHGGRNFVQTARITYEVDVSL